MRRDKLFLLDILEAADRIAARIAARDLASVTADEDLQDVVLRRLTVIGEAASALLKTSAHATRTSRGSGRSAFVTV